MSHKKCLTEKCYKTAVSYGYCLTCWNRLDVKERNSAVRALTEYGKWQLEELNASIFDNVEMQRADEAYSHPELSRMNGADFYKMHTFGLYFPPKDRVLYSGAIDTRSDGKPIEASVCTPADSNFKFDLYSNFDRGLIGDVIADGIERDQNWRGIKQQIIYLRKVEKPSKGFICLANGDWYCLCFGKIATDLSIVDDRIKIKTPGIFWEKMFIKIDFEKEKIQVALTPGISLKKEREFYRDLNRRATILASLAISAESDSRFLWHVRAFKKEDNSLIGNVRFGVYGEHVKSLFFARDLPLTETGRKRPILHWVSAHKRRVASGEDIDIEKHLRGTRLLEIGDTVFMITRPCEREDEGWLDFARNKALWAKQAAFPGGAEPLN